MSTAETTRQLVIFSLGSEEYALPITRVQEIIRYTEPRIVASRTAWIRGVINLRGKIVPVCDLAERLGLRIERSGVAKIVIAETATGTAGIIVDDVEEVADGRRRPTRGRPGRRIGPRGRHREARRPARDPAESGRPSVRP